MPKRKPKQPKIYPVCVRCGTDDGGKKKYGAEYCDPCIKQMLDVDRSLCFICQQVPPTYRLKSSRSKEAFNVCTDCSRAAVHVNKQENAIRSSLGRERIFTYTLGLDSTPVKLTITELKQSKSQEGE